MFTEILLQAIKYIHDRDYSIEFVDDINSVEHVEQISTAINRIYSHENLTEAEYTAFDDGYDSGYLKGHIDALEALNASKKVYIIWEADDVKAIAPELSDEECQTVLDNFDNHHEGSSEAMWQDLAYHANEFKKLKESNNAKSH